MVLSSGYPGATSKCQAPRGVPGLLLLEELVPRGALNYSQVVLLVAGLKS